MTLRKNLADAFIGTIPSIELPAIRGKKVITKRVTEVNGGRQELIEERQKYSVVGAFFRSLLASVIARKAISIYRKPSSEALQNPGGNSSNSPVDPYYHPIDHYSRIRRRLDSRGQENE